jgi:hypothetical protein
MGKRYKRLVLLSITLLGVVLIPPLTTVGGVVEGKVTSLHGDLAELNIGSEKGIRLGDSGKIYYKITVGGKERQIYVAKFKISHLSEKSSMAQIEDRTGEVRVDYLVEVTFKGGELEVRSEPSGAKVYLDGKEFGESPLLLSDVTPGRHLIRVSKEGYEALEILENIGGDRKKVMAQLKKVVTEGELVVRTEPSGATVTLNGRSVGKSPYEGRSLSPGIYRIRIVKEGYENWERTEIVDAGKRVEVLAQLTQLKPKEGDIEVRSEPGEGKVYLDGKYLGETPLLAPHIRPGRYSILVLKEGYHPLEERVEVKGGDRKRVLATLRRRMGALAVTLKTPGAILSIDGRPMEVGPGNTLEKEFPSGSYRITATKEGHETWERDLVVGAGERVEVSVELKTKEGELLVRTEPSGALIYLDGKSVGTGSYEKKGLSPGTYKIRVVKEGYEAWEGEATVEPDKRREVFSKLKEIDWSKRSCDAPVWNLGNSWTYRDGAGRFWSNQVFEIREDLFLLRIEGDRDLYAYDRKTMNCNYFIDRNGRKIRNLQAFKHIFNFPLMIGKRWRYSTESGSTNIVNELSVEGVEEVSIPAGTFLAYKIYYKQTEMSRMNSGWVRYWYAPAVKWWIKREVEMSPYWAREYRLQNAVLYYFILK